MHASLTTTRRYTQGMVDEASREAVAEVAGDLGELPATVRSSSVFQDSSKTRGQTGQNRPPMAGGGRGAAVRLITSDQAGFREKRQ